MAPELLPRPGAARRGNSVYAVRSLLLGVLRGIRDGRARRCHIAAHALDGFAGCEQRHKNDQTQKKANS